MKPNPLVPVICRAKRFARDFKPELRVRAEGTAGIYADKNADKPCISLKLDQDFAVPLLKAVAVVLAVVALVELLDD